MKDFKNILKESALIGLGLIVMTKEKIEEVAKDLQKEHNLTPEEGKKFVKQLLEKTADSRKKLEGEIEKIIKNVVSNLPIATKKDLENLEKKITKKSPAKKTTKK